MSGWTFGHYTLGMIPIAETFDEFLAALKGFPATPKPNVVFLIFFRAESDKIYDCAFVAEFVKNIRSVKTLNKYGLKNWDFVVVFPQVSTNGKMPDEKQAEAFRHQMAAYLKAEHPNYESSAMYAKDGSRIHVLGFSEGQAH